MDQCATLLVYNAIIVPVQVGTSLDHWPLAWHEVSATPCISYPGKHTKVTFAGYSFLSPSRDPWRGAQICGHLTAVT